MIFLTDTVDAVKAMGGGAEGWRTVAIICAIVGLLVNTISARCRAI